MRICIFGAGAVGSFLGASLAGTDADVTIFGRGAHFEKMRADGLRLRDVSGNEHCVRVRCESDIHRLKDQDMVISTVKAHALTGAAPQMRSMLAPNGAVAFAQNGIPWWYFYRSGTAFDNTPIPALDPGQVIVNSIAPEQVLGGVIFIGAAVPEPGVLLHSGGNRFIFGELDGTMTPRLETLIARLSGGNVIAEASTAIRDDLWLKLLGNISFNMVSALTRGTIGQIYRDPLVYAPTRQAIVEAREVAASHGVTFAMSIEERLKQTLALGEYVSSTLQDLNANRYLEIEALIGAVCSMARMTGVATPTLDLLYGFGRQLAQNLNLYPAPGAA